MPQTLSITQSISAIAVPKIAIVEANNNSSKPVCPIAAKPVFYRPQDAMIKYGYIPIQKIGNSLQGSVWKVKTIKNEEYIIKIASIKCTKRGVAHINGKQYRVKENIIKEASILKYLTNNDPPEGLVKFINFFSDENNYFLVQEFVGESSLFEFVNKCHHLINQNKLSINQWHKFCKSAMVQIVEVLDWMHNKMNCVHLDLSLENFVLSDILVEVGTNGTIRFIEECQVKLIDFGVSEVFETNPCTKKKEDAMFKCSKFVGKTPYKAPRVYARQIFDARTADCWSLSVCLFAMVTGCRLYAIPNKVDEAFQYVINGRLYDLILYYKKAPYVTLPILDLLLRTLRSEKCRINISDIKNHEWLN